MEVVADHQLKIIRFIVIKLVNLHSHHTTKNKRKLKFKKITNQTDVRKLQSIGNSDS